MEHSSASERGLVGPQETDPELGGRDNQGNVCRYLTGDTVAVKRFWCRIMIIVIDAL